MEVVEDDDDWPRCVFVVKVSYDQGKTWVETRIECCRLRRLAGQIPVTEKWFEMEPRR